MPKRKAIAIDMEGEGILSDAKSYANKAVKNVKKTAGSVAKKVNQTVATVKDVSDKLINGTTELPPKVLTMLKNYGQAIINQATIVRIPLNGMLNTALDVGSLGTFSKEMKKQPYDKCFHLRLD